jgi:hypothetical protein
MARFVEVLISDKSAFFYIFFSSYLPADGTRAHVLGRFSKKSSKHVARKVKHGFQKMESVFN